jgi:hypothetical protein
MNRALICGLMAAMAVPGASNAQVTQVGTYYEEKSSAACTATWCTQVFAVVPAGKRLTVNEVHCNFSARNGQLLHAEIGVQFSNGYRDREQLLHLNYTASTTSGPHRYYKVTLTPTRRIIEEGLRPYIKASGVKTGDGTMGVTVECMIIGVLTNAT